MVQEELTFPGEDPGIFACDYKKLARIAAAMGPRPSGADEQGLCHRRRWGPLPACHDAWLNVT